MFRQTTKAMKTESGFTMIEVLIAMLVFAAAIIGISGMMISGSENIQMAVADSKATNMASARIEEVKSLPFYESWNQEAGNRDIDDSYYNPAVTNAEQVNNPGVVEDYGQIPGATNYRRETAVQYVYPASDGGSSRLMPATMCTLSGNKWVPKDPGPGETDAPIGGSSSSSTGSLHAIMITVSVSYKVKGVERSYVARDVVTDSTAVGSSGKAYLLIESISVNPYASSITSAYYTEKNLLMTLKISSPADYFANSAGTKVYLSRAGSEDIYGKSVVVVNNSTVTCRFDLTQLDKDGNRVFKPGQTYDVSIYWPAGGWKDTLRSGFRVEAAAPLIDSIGGYDWAHYAQTARELTINGEGLDEATVYLSDGSNNIPGTVITNTSEKVVARFNVSAVPAAKDSINEYWDLHTSSLGGQAVYRDAILMNPPPKVTGISVRYDASTPYYNWMYRANNVRRVCLQGEYLYALDQDESSSTLTYGSYATDPTREVVGAGTVGAVVQTNDENVRDKTTPVVLSFNPSSAKSSGGSSVMNDDSVKVTSWTVNLSNVGGSTSLANCVTMNPTPSINTMAGNPASAFTGSKSGYTNYSGSTSYPNGYWYGSPITYTGQYLDDPEILSIGKIRLLKAGYGSSGTFLEMKNDTASLAAFQTVTGDSGSSTINNLKLGVSVNGNPSMNFKHGDWSTTATATNSQIGAGTSPYYPALRAGCGVVIDRPGVTMDITHMQYTVSAALKYPNVGAYTNPADYGTVSGGSPYQDELLTDYLSYTVKTNHKFFGWTNNLATNVNPGTNTVNPATTRATETVTYSGWFFRKLYFHTDALQNQGGFQKGVTTGLLPSQALTVPFSGDSNAMRLTTSDSTLFEASIGAYADVDLTGVTTVVVNWQQVGAVTWPTSSDNIRSYFGICNNGDKDKDHQRYLQNLGEIKNTFGSRWETITVSSGNATTNKAVKVVARVTGGSSRSDIRIYYTWIQ